MTSAAVDEALSSPGGAPRPSPPVRPVTRRSRRAAGHAARGRAPRRAPGSWGAVDGRRDALGILLAQNTIRAEDLLPVRNARMAANPWSCYRGAAAVMAADLGARPHSGLAVQLCGDAHLLDFGLWATPERNLSFALRDFDETLPGPFEWDVARLVASIVVLGRTHGVPAGRPDEAVAACLRSYRERMAGYASARWLDIWYDLIAVDEFLGVFSESDRVRAAAHIQRKARKCTHRGGFDKLTEHRHGHLRITEDPPIRQHRDDGLAEELFAAYRDSCPTSGATCSTGSPSSTPSARWSGSAASGCGCTWSCSRAGAGPIRCSCRSSRRAPRSTSRGAGRAGTPTTAAGWSRASGWCRAPRTSSSAGPQAAATTTTSASSAT